jgi:hypothetical protein
MLPTRGYVRQQFLGLLDDPAGAVWDPPNLPVGIISPFTVAFNEAYDVLFSAFLNQQVPQVENVLQGIIVPPMTTVLTPAAMGIADFADFEWIRERLAGSTDRFLDLIELDNLTQRQPADRLIETVWQNNAFQFIGATTVREIQIKYVSSGLAPTDNNTVIGIDNSASFLSNYAAGKAGPRKGLDAEGQACMMFAVGPKFHLGTIGGELFRLIQPLVRERQHVQIAHRPYTTERRRGIRRALPYVMAQQGTTGGGAQNVPVQFSNADGTIVGTIDGTNATFWLTLGVISFTLYRNGVLQTLNVDYTAINNQFTFLTASIPLAGDSLTAEGYPIY